jgi:CDP-paratose 2-epimerase
MKYKNILITGGAGFVGSNTAIKLKEKYPKTNVIVMDNLKRRGSELNITRLKDKGIVFVHGDIRNIEDFEGFGAIDLIIECSAEPSVLAGIDTSPTYLINTNLTGTVNCLEVARKNKSAFIFISTSRVYPIEPINSLDYTEEKTRFTITNKQKTRGVSSAGITEDFPLSGARSLYGTTKLASELMLEEYI